MMPQNYQYEIENKWCSLYAAGYLVNIHCNTRDKDIRDFSGDFQIRGEPTTKKFTPRFFSVIEVLEWIEKQVEPIQKSTDEEKHLAFTLWLLNYQVEKLILPRVKYFLENKEL